MIGFDLETYPIGPKRAPEVIVGALNIEDAVADAHDIQTWATRMKSVEGSRGVWFFWASELEHFLTLCENVTCPIVAHNGAYDWSCISADHPQWIGRIFKLFRAKKLHCTYIRTLTYLNGMGGLKTLGNAKLDLAHGKYGVTSYVGSVMHFAEVDLSEAKDANVQVTYHRMIGKPFGEWPSSYRDYLIQDVEYLPRLWYGQEAKEFVTLKSEYTKISVFAEVSRRSAIHYSLALASAWGLRVDGDAVRKLRVESEGEVQRVAELMVDAGLASHLTGKSRERAIAQEKLTIRVDNKAIQRRVEACYAERGESVPQTEKGSTNTSRRVLLDCGDTLLRTWAKVGDKKTIWSTFIPALEKSFKTHSVLTTHFFPYSETGRISARSPNLLNPPRSGGIRECIQAREGCTFIFCDYEANELRVLSQVLLDFFGQSRLAELYQADPHFDPHTYMACRRLGIPYEDGKKRKTEKEPELCEMRQLMKACNFGFPGGMASKTFIAFAAGYEVDVTEQEAEELKTFFFSQFPEIKEYLTRVGNVVNRYGGQGYLPRVGRLSGGRRFCQLANFYFQGLAAEGGLVAFTEVTEAAYSRTDSPLYGSRPVLFVHDEIIIECPTHMAHDAAMELKRIMETSMRRFTPQIPSVAEPTLATRWTKSAYQKFDSFGRLTPSDVE